MDQKFRSIGECSLKEDMQVFLHQAAEDMKFSLEEQSLNPLYFNDVLLFAAVMLPYLENKEKWEKFGYQLCWEMKQNLERYGVRGNDCSMVSRFGMQCFAADQYSRSSGNLKGFVHSLQGLLFQFAKNKADDFLENPPETQMMHYDMMVGLSGTLYYLLDCPQAKSHSEEIQRILQYLLFFAQEKEYEGNLVHGFMFLEKISFGRMRSSGFSMAISILGFLMA